MRVVVLSAYPTVRAGLRSVVLARSGWTVIGESSPPRLTGGRTEMPPDEGLIGQADILLADVDASSTVATLGALAAAMQPRLGLVAIGSFGTGPGMREALEAAVAPTGWLGALGLGLLPRDASAEEIVASMEAAASGLVALDRDLARALAGAPALAGNGSPARSPAPPEIVEGPEGPLTGRELEVLQLLAEGLANKTIAARLHVSEHTAKFHVASIMTKLGAASRTEAVTLAARRGLLIL